jgi:hypothetical protein
VRLLGANLGAGTSKALSVARQNGKYYFQGDLDAKLIAYR